MWLGKFGRGSSRDSTEGKSVAPDWRTGATRSPPASRAPWIAFDCLRREIHVLSVLLCITVFNSHLHRITTAVMTSKVPHEELQYLDLVTEILKDGERRPDRQVSGRHNRILSSLTCSGPELERCLCSRRGL